MPSPVSGASAPENQVFQVGDLVVDVGKQSVRRNGVDIALPNLSFKLLLALVHAAPNFLSNDALMEQVWPGVVVSPETVSKRAALLREALGDESRAPRYVLSLRSRGYRMVAPVTQASRAAPAADIPMTAAPPPGAAPTTELSSRPSPPRRLRSAFMLVAAIAVLLLIALAMVERRGAHHAAQINTLEASGTVAVLPFDNISADANDAYLAAGIPEMLLNRLSSIHELVVIARSSSFAIAGKSLESADIGARLKAAYLVEGSVQRDGGQLRIGVELIDAASGKSLWSQRFDRQVRDLLAVEDEIGAQVANVLLTRFGGRASTPILRERSDNIEAYLSFLRGTTLLNRFTVADSDAAIPQLERAVELDPHFAPGYAALYDAHMQAAARRYEDLEPVRTRFQFLIERALTIDPKSGAAYFARAIWSDPHGSSDARAADFRRGVELDPSNGRGLTAYSEFLDINQGDREGSARMLHRALLIDPISPRAHFRDAISSLEDSGYQVVEQKMLEVLELDPNFVPALQRYGKYRWELHGELAGGLQVIEHAIALDPLNPWLRHAAMAMYLDLGDVAAAEAVAATTPQSAASANVLLSLHAGDLQAAHRAAAQGTAGWEFGLYENWGASEALRDYALQSGELDGTIAFLEDRFKISLDGPPRLDIGNFRQAFFLSQLLAAQGQSARAAQLRQEVERWNDANEAKFGALYARRLRATMLLVDGKRDAALTELAESFHSLDYLQWWYVIERDPTWQPLHGDARFRAIAADVRQYVEKQRKTLQELRERGLVPVRGALKPTR